MKLINSLKNLKRQLLRITKYYERRHQVLAHLRYIFRFTGNRKHSLPCQLIVSLTSYPPRFPVLHLTLKTLLSQSLSPDLTILWLYKEDIKKLTPEISTLVGENFEIRAVEEDTKSYKKLIPAIQEFPGAYIVTADDDTYYETNWLRDLVLSLRADRKEVIGHRGHYILAAPNGAIAGYDTWQWNIDYEKADSQVFLTGVGGILYPPGALTSEALKADDYIKLCPRSDDIWFYFMTRRNGFVGRKIIGDFTGYTWGETQEVALFHSNVAGGANDRAMQAMVSKYGSPL